MAVVIENVSRPDRAIVDEFCGYGVATVHEAQGRTGLLTPNMRPIFAGAYCRIGSHCQRAAVR